MKTEELEISLRTEFENYLREISAQNRREISEFQERAQTELDGLKLQIDEVFREALSRIEQTSEIDTGFKEMVVEHLRLARDEGARITATAIEEAEEMRKQSAPVAGIKELHEAVQDIGKSHTQTQILKSLVKGASCFAPRGAFFVIKNSHFIGWRAFGDNENLSPEAMREISLPLSADSILSEAVRSLVTVEANAETFSDDAEILSRLGFGSPESIFAIPLVARDRGVAVLYADYGTSGAEINIEALETLVRFAGLAVEVLANGATSSKESKGKSSRAFATEGFSADTLQSGHSQNFSYPLTVESDIQTDDNFSDASLNEFQLKTSETESLESSTSINNHLGERDVDLPIEVSDDERHLHNDAHRFARLLVSEIKLYNEEKVREGIRAGDLYERLAEAIDRSRETYDQRVSPQVAARFDYFHYELVNALAEGDINKLGTSYSGQLYSGNLQ